MARVERSAALCTSCGLCCTDLLFSVVELTASETTRARGRKLPLVERDGNALLPLPCPNLDETRRCTDYEHRPTVCRDFRCVLLREVESDRVPLEEALATVERVHAMVAKLFPAGRKVLDPRAMTPEHLLDFGALEAILTRSFRDPRRSPSGEVR
jgi:Fe-S-cluster containining protein